MKILSVLTLAGAVALAGCGGTSNSLVNNTANNANLRGTNTNTGYVTNTNDTVKPTVPANATNITPGNLTTNSNTHSNSNSKTNKP